MNYRRLLQKQTIVVFILLLIVASCSGCAREYVYIKQDIPALLLEPCDVPELMGDTYADVIQLAYNQKIALQECNIKIETIREIINNPTH